MTNGNEPAGPESPDDDKTTVVQRPDQSATPSASTPEPADAAAAAQTQIGQPAPVQSDATTTASPWQQHGQPGETPVAPTQQFGGTTEQIGQPGQQSPSGFTQPQPQYGGQPGQFTPPAGGQPQYDQSAFAQPQPGQAQPGQPQYGQVPQGQPQYGQFPPQGQPVPGQPGQYGQPAYGQPFGQQPPAGQPGGDPTLNPFAPPTKKKKTGLLVGVGAGLLIVVAAIVAITAFWAPGWAGKNLNQAAVEEGVTQVLTSKNVDEGYNISDVKDVECPDGQKVEVDATFTCSLKVNGESKHVTVTIKDKDGTYEVSRPTN